MHFLCVEVVLLYRSRGHLGFIILSYLNWALSKDCLCTVLIIPLSLNSLPTNDAYMRHVMILRKRPMTHICVMALKALRYQQIAL